MQMHYSCNSLNIPYLLFFFFFFFNDTATTEIYTLHIVGSVRCVQETVPPPEHLQVCDQKLKDKREPYILKPSSDSVFLEGKQAQIMYKNQVVGKIGILHPEILDTYEWPYPISLFELNLEPLFDSV
eukprot:TRINITY_DN48_c0_g1_i4.p2 TRINITY_DN48_c0_g1~~TRINITY_DN48_c0_g1_i4.p2  ORF type:complete len:127 (+),score=39.74 TRINITY_DN48_c0_g1_i4:2-382(+)